MTPRRTADDLNAWVRLVVFVEEALRAPEKSTVALERAVTKARRAVLPAPPYTADNPYVKLLAAAQEFAGQLGYWRAANPLRLREALKAAMALRPVASMTPSAEPPTRRFRADIDG